MVQYIFGHLFKERFFRAGKREIAAGRPAAPHAAARFGEYSAFMQVNLYVEIVVAIC